MKLNLEPLPINHRDESELYQTIGRQEMAQAILEAIHNKVITFNAIDKVGSLRVLRALRIALKESGVEV